MQVQEPTSTTRIIRVQSYFHTQSALCHDLVHVPDAAMVIHPEYEYVQPNVLRAAIVS